MRTGNGAGREDVNVSVTGGQRVEIKGVPSIALIPKLTHNEAYRQRALLLIKEELNRRVVQPKDWRVTHTVFSEVDLKLRFPRLALAVDGLNQLNRGNVVVVNLPQFKGLLSFFTQLGRAFSDELADRLKVIACLEKPNLLTSEDISGVVTQEDFVPLCASLPAGPEDALIIFLSPTDDIKTAVETIEERCRLAFAGVPNETRKPKRDGTTLFERVLPGPDRMYPDTDSAPIPISVQHVATLMAGLPRAVSAQMTQMNEWHVPTDTHEYLLRHNLLPLFRRIVDEFSVSPVFVAALLGHTLKNIQGKMKPSAEFDYKKVYGLFKFVTENKLGIEIVKTMLPVVYEHPNIEFASVLELIDFKPATETDIQRDVPFLYKKFQQIKKSKRTGAVEDWIMGQVRRYAVGSLPLKEVRRMITEACHDI
ncbi:MAG: hypothetical protein ACD_62C00257G0001 [uncultured bacterium]|nr:MAG: hypothetical protein ACD_62C00257G0001 [uncultured bacterium]